MHYTDMAVGVAGACLRVRGGAWCCRCILLSLNYPTSCHVRAQASLDVEASASERDISLPLITQVPRMLIDF